MREGRRVGGSGGGSIIRIIEIHGTIQGSFAQRASTGPKLSFRLGVHRWLHGTIYAPQLCVCVCVVRVWLSVCVRVCLLGVVANEKTMPE